MVKRMTPSQYKSHIRQLQNKQKQAVNKYNQEVRRYNQEQQRTVNKCNQEIRKYNQDAKRTINKYNQEVRTHNSRVRTNQQRIKHEIAKLQSKSTSSQHTVFRTSVNILHKTYLRFEEQSSSEQLTPSQELVFDLVEKENANSLEVMNALLGDEGEIEETSEKLQDTKMADELSKISNDLDKRWHGALYSLSPQNPDAARHFCTSAREIFTEILEIKAPDNDVFYIFPNCDKTERGNPTRHSKIKFLLNQKGMSSENLENFIQQDVDNILQLFRDFNDGTHGSAGKFDLHTLFSIKRRVEDGIIFLVNIVNSL